MDKEKDKGNSASCKGQKIMGCCARSEMDGKHQPMQRFMETSLLVLLIEQESHGYSLAEQLANFGFKDINVSTLYRVMRKMEERGWVISSWEEGAKGPQRRVYSITNDGIASLDEWIEVFKERRGNIDLLISAYNKRGK